MENLSADQLIQKINELEQGITQYAKAVEVTKAVIANDEHQISMLQLSIAGYQATLERSFASIKEYNDELYALSEQLKAAFNCDPIDFLRRLNGLHEDRAKLSSIISRSLKNADKEEEPKDLDEHETIFTPNQLDFIFTLFKELAKEDIRLERFAHIMTRAGYYYPFEVIALPQDAIVGIDGFGKASWKSYIALLQHHHLAPYKELSAKQKEQMIDYVTHNYNTLTRDVKVKNQYTYELESEILSRIDKYKR
ncbi:MAG: hypothetical protein WCO55_04285 [Candidatus Falkowbacteria bacterium]